MATAVDPPTTRRRPPKRTPSREVEGALGIHTSSEHVHTGAGRAFGELVGPVQSCMDAGLVPVRDATDVAQQVWATVHGAVSLELKGLVLTPDPEQTYLALLDLLLRGLVSPREPG